MFIHEILQRVTAIGLTAGIADDEMRRVRIVNAFSFVTALLCTFCGVALSVISGDWLICYTALVFVCGFLGILLLNKKKRFVTARLGLQSVFCGVLLYYGCVFGESAQVPFLGLFLTGLPLLICSPRERALRSICLLMPLLALFLLETNYYYSVFVPMQLDRTALHLFRWLIMGVVLLLNCMVITFYLYHIDSLLLLLQAKNESLKKKNIVVQQKENALIRANRLLEDYNERLENEVRQRTIELTDKSVVQESIMANLNISLRQLEQKDRELEQYITELETLKSSLVLARDEAERANSAKSAFLRELSHEIRNPLNAILGISYLLLNNTEHNLPPGVKRYLENIHLSGHNLLGIINNVLELASIEAGKVREVREEPLQVRDWINSVAGVHRHAGQAKGLSIHVQVDAALPVQVMGDKVQLTQVVNNLLGNAVKFTPERRNITLSCMRNGPDRWQIRVQDEGEGIPAEKQALIFQPFEQADASIHRRFGGTGLGLAISKRIVELMGGDISLWSQPGAGTCFTVSLPLRPVQAPVVQPVSLSVPLVQEKIPLASGKPILLMEDSGVNRMVVREFMERLGLPLLAAENGEMGLKMAREHLPAVIILDMHMPKMNGSQVMRELRNDALLARVPVIMISADAFEEQQAQAMKEGVTMYMPKPIRFEELRDALARYINNAGGVEEERTLKVV